MGKSLFKTAVLKPSLRWHRWLGWTGGLALLMFAISGMLHPVMSWTGPKAAAFFPPQAVFSSQHAAAIPEILQRHAISRALFVKAVPSKDGAVLQVTESRDAPRRYFTLPEGRALPDYDAIHAQWLARYYTGLSDAPVADITFQTAFDAAYPWVNRLLPVYKVTFDSPDARTAFIYTELNALAGMTDARKTVLQGIFRALHTWEWLGDYENTRVILMSALLLSLLGMAAAGTALVFLMKNRTMPLKRKIHRFISCGVWVPLLMFSSSGIYHMLQYAYGERHRGLQTGAVTTFSAEDFGEIAADHPAFAHKQLNGISVIDAPDGGILYRLSLPQGRPGQNITQGTRFDGTATEKPAYYIHAATGEDTDLTDKDMAIFYAQQRHGFFADSLTQATRITRFGPHYDFRNKRLPVWQLDYDTPRGDKIFIDPATGAMVDRLTNKERYEGYSFSILHKWSPLTPLTGRKARDIMMVIILSLAVFMTILGYMLLLRRKR